MVVAMGGGCFYFLMVSPKIIYLKTAPPPLEFNFLLFDAGSENHIPENSPPPPEFNFLLFDAESENHIPKNSPPPGSPGFPER